MESVKPIKDTPKVNGRDAVSFREALEHDFFGEFTQDEIAKRTEEDKNIKDSYHYFKSIATEGVF